MAFAYILECSDGTYYVGSTRSLEHRVWQHQSGDGAAYTRHRRPVRLVWSAEFEHVGAAFAFEKQVQGWSRRKRQALIRGEFDALPGLASRAWRFSGGGFETGASAPSSTTDAPGASAPSSTTD